MRRILVVVVLIALVGGGYVLVADGGQPNIVLISVDTLRADHLPCYGYERETAPHICALAEEGILYERAYTQASWTRAAHASLMTGQYPKEHGVMQSQDTLPTSTTTVAERLQGHGYSTAAFVGSCGPGADCHSDETFNGHLTPASGLDQGFDTYWAQGMSFWDTVPPAERAAQELEEPFFMFVHGYDVHSLYGTPSSWEGTEYAPSWGVEYRGRRYSETSLRQGPEGIRLQLWNGTEVPLDRSVVEAAIDRYDSGIRYADHRIGDLLAGLKEQGRYQDTWIVVVGDHGEVLGERVMEDGAVFGHGEVFPSVARVPMIIRPPGGVDEQRVSGLVELIDIVPTLMSHIAGGAPTEVSGSLLPPWGMAKGPAFSMPPAVVIDGPWLLRSGRNYDHETALYNLSRDQPPDVAEEYPSVVRELESQLDRHGLRLAAE